MSRPIFFSSKSSYQSPPLLQANDIASLNETIQRFYLHAYTTVYTELSTPVPFHFFFSVTVDDSPLLLAKAKSFTCILGFVSLHLLKDVNPEIFMCLSCFTFLSLLDYISL